MTSIDEEEEEISTVRQRPEESIPKQTRSASLQIPPTSSATHARLIGNIGVMNDDDDAPVVNIDTVSFSDTFS